MTEFLGIHQPGCFVLTWLGHISQDSISKIANNLEIKSPRHCGH